MDKRICDELHDFVQIKCLAMTPEQRLHVVFEHLLSTHGPHSNLDVTQLTARVTELSPNTMGWAKYLPKFMHTVTTLASMKQRDPRAQAGTQPCTSPTPNRRPRPGQHHPSQPLHGHSDRAGTSRQSVAPRRSRTELQAAGLPTKERPPPVGEDRQPHGHQ